MTDWVRLWHDMPTDPKWRVIARKSGQPLACVLALFTLMLTNASNNAADRGTLLAWDHEDAGAALDMDADAVEAIHSAMQGKVLDGDKLTGWDRRQPKREDNSSARVARHRNDKKRDVTQCNAPETDTDTETEEPKGSVAPKRANAIFICPIGVNPQHWRDFMANRKRRNLATTQTAYEGILRDIATLSNDEWPPGKLVELAARKGWGSIIIPDGEFQNGRRKGNGSSESGHGSTVDAAQRFLARHSAAAGQPS